MTHKGWRVVKPQHNQSITLEMERYTICIGMEESLDMPVYKTAL